jgi:hypothetical protein
MADPRVPAAKKLLRQAILDVLPVRGVCDPDFFKLTGSARAIMFNGNGVVVSSTQFFIAIDRDQPVASSSIARRRLDGLISAHFSTWPTNAFAARSPFWPRR